jgi:hypothetical protein
MSSLLYKNKTALFKEKKVKKHQKKCNTKMYEKQILYIAIYIYNASPQVVLS